MMPPLVTSVSTTAVGFAGLLSTGATACSAAHAASAHATAAMVMRCFMVPPLVDPILMSSGGPLSRAGQYSPRRHRFAHALDDVRRHEIDELGGLGFDQLDVALDYVGRVELADGDALHEL